MSRIKAAFRSRGIRTPGRGVYQLSQHSQWLEQLTEPGLQQRVAWLYEQLDQLRPLRRKAKQAMLRESCRHRAVELLRTIPQIGRVRAAQIVATVDTPHRFRTKRPFWSYSGLAVVTHMSAEYEMREGRVVRRKKPVATRGLNRNSNRRLKELFVSAAVGGSQTEPYRTYLEQRKQNGMRAEMARLTLARKIAAIALTIWEERRAVRSQEAEHDDIAVSSGYRQTSGFASASWRCARNGRSRVRISPVRRSGS